MASTLRTVEKTPSWAGVLGAIAIAVALFMLFSLFTARLAEGEQVAVAGVFFIGGALLRIEAAIKRNRSQ